jgi:translation initiation factor IF-1
MSWSRIIDRLEAGESVSIRPTGNSMTPRIMPKDKVTISPIKRAGRLDHPIEEGMVVLAKVNGRHFLHLVSGRTGDRIQISNNHGHVNGWTHIDKVYGYVSAIED